jgi:hypothetical protein
MRSGSICSRTTRAGSRCETSTAASPSWRGLEGLTLVEDALDAAIERARRRPGYAGTLAPPGAATAERVGAAVG